MWLPVEFTAGQPSIGSDTAAPSNPTSAAAGDDAQASLDLGALQIDLNEFDSAEASYLRGIELLIEDRGEFSPRLVDPYRQLAHVYVQLGQHIEALTVLEHAQHINQRNYGLFNTDQTVIIDEMSYAHQAAGHTRSALEIQEESLNIARRRFGEDSLEVIPFYYRLAEYYELSRMRAKARQQYEEVVEILETHLDEYADEQLKPLRELVRIDILSGDSSSARRRIEDILELGSGISALERARALAILGDWALATGRAEAGLAHYRDAYTTLAASDDAAATEFFASPALIDFIPPASPVDRTAGISSYAWGSITADFEVTTDGRARNVEIVAATPPGLLDARYRRRLMESHFRPRLVGGIPVSTVKMRFTHRFRYFPVQ